MLNRENGTDLRSFIPSLMPLTGSVPFVTFLFALYYLACEMGIVIEPHPWDGSESDGKLIDWLGKYLLSSYCVSGTALSTGRAILKEADSPSSPGTYS